jgi:hypothetical protein
MTAKTQPAVPIRGSRLRAGVFPLWSGILLMAATVGWFFVAEYLRPVAGQLGSAGLGIRLAVALMWIGLSIWNGGSIREI